MKITKAVIPAAGMGTRFLPATKSMPKEMLPVVDKPVIQYVVEDAVSAGVEDIVLVTGWHKRSLEDHFDYPFELLERLKEAGIVSVRYGEYQLYGLASRDQVADVLAKYRATLVDKVVDNYIEMLDEL